MPDTISLQPRPAPEANLQTVKRLQGLFSELSGIDAAALDPDATFLDLGLDSLFLTQASNALQKRLGVKVSMRELLDDCSTLQALAARVAPSRPLGVFGAAVGAAIDGFRPGSHEALWRPLQLAKRV